MFIGIDTSNYTTSVALSDGDKTVNIRRLLSVKQGERGLRQSDALFQHIKQFPELFEAVMKNAENIKAVGVSTRPRSCDGSYMPVFLAGESFARVLSAALKAPLFEFSHQDGHIMAALYSLGSECPDEKFLSVHISGGTTEIIVTRYNGYNFDTEIVGGTKDISAGQFIDRTGVKMGMSFPCGKQLDEFSKSATEITKLPVCEKDGYINFSGVETKLQRTENIDANLVLGVFDNIARSLVRAINFCMKKYDCDKVIIAGGVASNSYISEYMKSKINGSVYIAQPQYATDNAVGIAVLTERVYKNEQFTESGDGISNK